MKKVSAFWNPTYILQKKNYSTAIGRTKYSFKKKGKKPQQMYITTFGSVQMNF